MHHRRTRSAITLVAAVLIPLVGLTACGRDDDTGASSSSGSSASPEPSETGSDPAQAPDGLGGDESPEAGEESSGDASETATPAWAQPVTTPGTLLTTGKVGDVTVEIYQVGTEKATKDGLFADPDTNKPILSKGDELVFVNYVITNTGDPVDLGSSRVSISPRYDDWKWMQGMDGSTDDALFESQGVNDDSLAPGGFNELGIYPFGTGETYSVGGNFAHQKNSPITFDVTLTPVDAEGELMHDDRAETKIQTTIK